uniref:Gustatory receptor n=1 Tax=Anopheles christyi TaxID=43041 RepID=A0A182JPJ0_9DIPT
MNLVLPLLPTGRQLLSAVFIIFKCIGFLPFPFDCYTFTLKSSSTARALLHLPILQCFFFLTIHCMIMSNRVTIFYTGLQILSLNDILKYGTLMSSVFVIFINIGLQRNTHRLVWKKLTLIRRKFRKACDQRLTRHYLSKFCGYLVFSGVLEAQVLYLLFDSPSDIAYWVVIFLLQTFHRLRHLYHMFFIDVLKIYLEQLHNDLVEIRDYMQDLQAQPQNTEQFRKMYARAVDRLLELKSVYGQLWEFGDCINRNFGWSQICNFTSNFVQLSCDLYWLYLSMRVFKVGGYQEVLIVLLPSSSLIVLLLKSAESCLGEAASLQSALLEIPMGNDSTFKKIVYRFGLQMAQQQILLNAHGLFEINYSLLKMVKLQKEISFICLSFSQFCTGITTYMIIFITFSKELSPKRPRAFDWESFCFILLNFGLVTMLVCWIHQNQSLVIFSDTWLGYVVDFSKFIFMIFTYYSLFLECGFQRGVLLKVWNEVEQLQNLFPHPKWALQQWVHLRTVAFFAIYMSWWEITFAYCISKTARSTNFTIAFWVLFLLLHLRQLQILLYTDLLGFCLQVLNTELAWTIELSKGASRYGGRRSDGQICAQLHKLMIGFARAERLLELLNQAFGYSMLIIKLMNNFYILTDTYWIVQGFISGKVLSSLYLEGCLSSKFICLMINLNSNERILSECHRTRVLLHCVHLRWQLRCNHGWQMVQHFLLKAESTRPFAMTALSMFRLDYGTMMQIAFNVTASISLFIQASQ